MTQRVLVELTAVPVLEVNRGDRILASDGNGGTVFGNVDRVNIRGPWWYVHVVPFDAVDRPSALRVVMTLGADERVLRMREAVR